MTQETGRQRHFCLREGTQSHPQGTMNWKDGFESSAFSSNYFEKKEIQIVPCQKGSKQGEMENV